MILLRRTLKSLQNAARHFNFSTVNSISAVDRPSTTYYDELINQAGRVRDFDAIQSLLNKRHRDGFFNTNNTFKFISTDLSVLDDILKTLAGVQNGFPRKNAHDCLIAHLSKISRTRDALRVAEIMVVNKFGATAASFHPILNVLTRKKSFDEAWGVVEMMKKSGIKPDVTAYNYLLTAYCFRGDLNSAAHMLTRIEEEGLEADTRTYDALVLGACRSGKLDGALMILRRMVDDGVPPLYSTHAHVINTMMKFGYYSHAVDFVMGFGGKDYGLDTENFGVLADRLIGLDKLDEAKFLLREMRRRGLRMGEKLRKSYDLLVGND